MGMTAGQGNYNRQAQESVNSAILTLGHASRFLQVRGRFMSLCPPPLCTTCGKPHPGVCYKATRGCFTCGSTQHKVKDCPQGKQKQSMPADFARHTSYLRGNKRGLCYDRDQAARLLVLGYAFRSANAPAWFMRISIEPFIFQRVHCHVRYCCHRDIPRLRHVKEVRCAKFYGLCWRFLDRKMLYANVFDSSEFWLQQVASVRHFVDLERLEVALCVRVFLVAIGRYEDRVNPLLQIKEDSIGRRCVVGYCAEVEDSTSEKPLEIPMWKWDEISMDFVTGLPTTQKRHDAIWVVVDRLTKSAHFLPIRKNYGIRLQKIGELRFLKFSTAFHPQTDGQSERTIQTLEDMLRDLCWSMEELKEASATIVRLISIVEIRVSSWRCIFLRFRHSEEFIVLGIKGKLKSAIIGRLRIWNVWRGFVSSGASSKSIDVHGVVHVSLLRGTISYVHVILSFDQFSADDVFVGKPESIWIGIEKSHEKQKSHSFCEEFFGKNHPGVRLPGRRTLNANDWVGQDGSDFDIPVVVFFDYCFCFNLRGEFQELMGCEWEVEDERQSCKFTLSPLDVLQGFSFFLQMGFTLILATLDGLDVGLLEDVIGEDDCDDDG
ncbi:retrotransposon protein, putative, ty3-gypsy subclass [Tanacetum coccineum]|uniref:Retrotransposon protein, putative, ty3-gypsy subclass n=1 Tax=Tanacetum coccineum TaxID=301880 RepID=A0ABQ4YAP8_9ASTR